MYVQTYIAVTCSWPGEVTITGPAHGIAGAIIDIVSSGMPKDMTFVVKPSAIMAVTHGPVLTGGGGLTHGVMIRGTPGVYIATG
jgi:hypothetical protein